MEFYQRTGFQQFMYKLTSYLTAIVEDLMQLGFVVPYLFLCSLLLFCY